MVKTLSCPNCKALLPFPEGVLLVRCDFCGATCDLRSTRPSPGEQPPASPIAKATPARNSVQELHAEIKANALEIGAYKVLRRIYEERAEHDKAWCLCATLSYLGQADPEEQELYERLRPGGFVRARARATDELWRRSLLHPDEDRHLCAIFAIVSSTLAAITASPHKKFGLKRKRRRDLSTDSLPISKMFNYAISVLNLVTPDLYLGKEHRGLMMANTEEAPSFVAGADISEGLSEQQLAFVVGKQLSYLRPEHFLRRVLLTPSQARSAFFAALGLAQPQFVAPPDEADDVRKIQKGISAKLNSEESRRLGEAVGKYMESGGEADINRWWSTIELSANRVGFVLCNDIKLAADTVRDEPAEVGAASPRERVKDLVAYSVSEEYFQLRDDLGLGAG